MAQAPPIVPSLNWPDGSPESIQRFCEQVYQILLEHGLAGAAKNLPTTQAEYLKVMGGISRSGFIAPDKSFGDVTIPAGHTLMHANLTIQAGHRYFNNGTMICWGSLSISGDLDNLGDIYIPPLEPT